MINFNLLSILTDTNILITGILFNLITYYISECYFKNEIRNDIGVYFFRALKIPVGKKRVRALPIVS
jgi:hypothetical protein